MSLRVRAASLCVLLSLSMGIASCSLDNEPLTLAVSVEDPAADIAENMRAALSVVDIPIEVVVASQQTDVISNIRNNELDLAIIEEPGEPLSDLNTLAPLYPSVLHILNSRLDKNNNFSDVIRGAAVYAGPTGGAAQRLLLQLAYDFGVGEDQFQILENPWTQRPDVYFIFGGLLSQESIAQFSEFRLFSFATGDELGRGSVADGIVLRHHHLRPFLLPKGIYPTLADEAIVTLSIRSILIARPTFDEESAYDIAETLFGRSQELARLYPLVTQELNENAEMSELMLPLHEGTRRYLNRDRPGFIERNVDVLALYFTIAITLLTGVFALIRHRSQARKDRVDIYYARLLEIRDKAKHMQPGPDRSGCFSEVLQVQREVLELLVDERISADSSLVAFVSLSNQMLNEFQS